MGALPDAGSPGRAAGAAGAGGAGGPRGAVQRAVRFGPRAVRFGPGLGPRQPDGRRQTSLCTLTPRKAFAHASRKGQKQVTPVHEQERVGLRTRGRVPDRLCPGRQRGGVGL